MNWFIVTLGLAATWAWSGFIKLEIGWKGKTTWLGSLIPDSEEVGPGWHWRPWPFGIIPADVRRTVLQLDEITAITRDGVEVKVGGSAARRVSNLDDYFNVGPGEADKWIKDTRQAAVRALIHDRPLDDVLGKHTAIGADLTTALQTLSPGWGVEILGMMIPKIEPTSSGVVEDLASNKREQLQRDSQATEIKHVVTQVNKLMQPPPEGSGYTREQAIEQIQMTLGKLKKESEAHAFSLDAATAGIVKQFVDAIAERVK